MSRAATWWGTVIQNRLVGLVLAMVVIVPLVAVPVDTWMQGAATFVIEAFAIILMATLLWRARWNLSRESITNFLRTGVNLPVLLFMALAVVSLLLSPQKSYSAAETLRLGSGVLLYFVIAYQFRRSEFISRLTDTLTWLAIAVSVVACIVYATTSAERAAAPFGDAQLLGSFLMVLLPILGAAAMSEGNPKRQIVARIAVVLTLACLLLTQTRSAWIGLAAGGVTFALLGLLMLRRQSRGGGLRKHELVLPVMLVTIAIGFFLLVSPERATLINRIGTLSSAGEESSWKWRQSMYDGSIKMIKERPLTGHGIGLFPYTQQEYTGRGVRYLGCCSSSTLSEQAHSFWLQLGAELGIPGILLMGSIIVAFLISGGRRLIAMDPGSRRMLLMGTLASTVAFAVDAATSPSWQFGHNTLFLWLTLGLGVSCMRPQPRTREQTVEQVSVSPRFTRPAVAMATLALAVLLPTIGLAKGEYPTYCLRIKKATMAPKNITVNSGDTVCFTLEAEFYNGVVADVTCDTEHTIWKQKGVSITTQSGCNMNCFTFNSTTKKTVTIIGRYKCINSGEDSTHVTVLPGPPP